MAELYLARAIGISGFEKLVALKCILPQYATNEEFIAMFLDEARIAGTLSHPNIGHVYEVGEVGESYYFAMEFVHGENAASLYRRSQRRNEEIPLEHCLSVAIGICAGLHYAHEKTDEDGELLGIVHRDVSPSNILITYDGSVKVVDFGVAKAASQEHSTQRGALKGKITYMSPEQCRGTDIDRRSDIFSIGVVLYQLSTGERLFRTETQAGTITQILRGVVPPPESKRPDYPKALSRIVMRALAVDKDERYETAEQMQIELEEFARDQKLRVSSVALGRYMRDLFSDKLEAWNHAKERGETLGEHIAKTESGEEPAPTVATAPMPLRRGSEIGTPTAGGELAPSRSVRSSRNRTAAIAGAITVALAVFGVIVYSRLGGETEEQPPASGAPQPAVPTGEPESAPAPEPNAPDEQAAATTPSADAGSVTAPDAGSAEADSDEPEATAKSRKRTRKTRRKRRSRKPKGDLDPDSPFLR